MQKILGRTFDRSYQDRHGERSYRGHHKSLCSTAPRAGHDKRSRGHPEAIEREWGAVGYRYTGIGKNMSIKRCNWKFPTFKLSIAGLVIIEARTDESGFDATSRLI
jgi:hypothetical protein